MPYALGRQSRLRRRSSSVVRRPSSAVFPVFVHCMYCWHCRPRLLVPAPARASLSSLPPTTIQSSMAASHLRVSQFFFFAMIRPRLPTADLLMLVFVHRPSSIVRCYCISRFAGRFLMLHPGFITLFSARMKIAGWALCAFLLVRHIALKKVVISVVRRY